MLHLLCQSKKELHFASLYPMFKCWFQEESARWHSESLATGHKLSMESSWPWERFHLALTSPSAGQLAQNRCFPWHTCRTQVRTQGCNSPCERSTQEAEKGGSCLSESSQVLPKWHYWDSLIYYTLSSVDLLKLLSVYIFAYNQESVHFGLALVSQDGWVYSSPSSPEPNRLIQLSFVAMVPTLSSGKRVSLEPGLLALFQKLLLDLEFISLLPSKWPVLPLGIARMGLSLCFRSEICLVCVFSSCRLEFFLSQLNLKINFKQL